jgi:hypothetical protein
VATRCAKHNFELAAAVCRTCGDDFCEECLVYAHGPSKPPYCVPCALVAAGVRRHSPSQRKLHRSRRGVRGGEPVTRGEAEGEEQPAVRMAGRSRVGLLAAAGATIAVVVPVVAYLH